MEKKKWIRGGISGIAAGVINGFFGGGGGLVLVPLLKRFVGLHIKKAHATCVAIAAMMSIVTATVYLVRGAVTFGNAGWYMVGGAIGGLGGGLLLGKISKEWLRRIFGVFLVYSAVRMVWGG